MKKIAAVFLIVAACSLGAAERYRSAGFSAGITENGVIRNLEYAGQPLASSIFLTGEYKLREGAVPPRRRNADGKHRFDPEQQGVEECGELSGKLRPETRRDRVLLRSGSEDGPA